MRRKMISVVMKKQTVSHCRGGGNAVLLLRIPFRFPKKLRPAWRKPRFPRESRKSRNSGSSSIKPTCAKFLEVPHASAATETRPFGFCHLRKEREWARSGPPAFWTVGGARGRMVEEEREHCSTRDCHGQQERGGRHDQRVDRRNTFWLRTRKKRAASVGASLF